MNNNEEQIKFDAEITNPLSINEAEHYFKTISSDITSTTEVEILQELRGKYLTKVSLCYISSFNPDRLKIVLANHGETMEGKEGCATVYLNDQNQIEKVTLGITLKLPKHDFDTIDCDGHIMECLLQGWKYR